MQCVQRLSRFNSLVKVSVKSQQCPTWQIRAMAVIGATSQSSVILSASQPGSTEILRLGFDRNRNLYTWDGTVNELQEFCVHNLELLEPKLSSSERCTSLKTKGVTFTLDPSTKTLQVQGKCRFFSLLTKPTNVFLKATPENIQWNPQFLQICNREDYQAKWCLPPHSSVGNAIKNALISAGHVTNEFFSI